MPLGSAGDLDFMLKDAGLPVSFGSLRTHGLRDEEDIVTHMTDGSAVETRATVLRIRRGTLAGVQVDNTIIVDGTSYRVRRGPVREGDGSLEQLIITEVL